MNLTLARSLVHGRPPEAQHNKREYDECERDSVAGLH